MDLGNGSQIDGTVFSQVHVRELHFERGDSDDFVVAALENGHLLGHCCGLSYGVLLHGHECWLGSCHVPPAGAS